MLGGCILKASSNCVVSVCAQGVTEEFDWASYLLEGEDVIPRHYVDSPVSKNLLALLSLVNM